MLVVTLKSFAGDESGATAIEYALLGTLIAITLFGTFAVVGNSLFAILGDGPGSAAEVIDGQFNK